MKTLRSKLLQAMGLSLLLSSGTSALALDSASLRTSSLGRDFGISATLGKALAASFGRIAAVQQDAGGAYSLTFNNDKLACAASKCRLQWDTSSGTYPQDAGNFKAALFDVLYYYAQNEGRTDPDLQLSVFTQTGSIQLQVRELIGNDDHVSCFLLNPGSSNDFKECSLVVSDLATGTEPELRAAYEQLVATKSLVDAQKEALITSVKTDLFLGPGETQYGNGMIELQRTLYTDLLADGVSATAYYAYKVPVTDEAGRVVSNGIRITLLGGQFPGHLVLDQVAARSYALFHPIP